MLEKSLIPSDAKPAREIAASSSLLNGVLASGKETHLFYNT
jgi:hypothetical protein